ncbi:DS-domain-containing protein [Byssothecium circinans]|uniref:Deoxyhypusine synthase n=1 Tax=Byssothecium circinans TaxID=147558 RepID=A0A6A5TYB4_9PLEO|nr:DS-domain-containing protein [Byssothecium circinans]
MTSANQGTMTGAPSGATDAVLKPSDPVPEGSREVRGIDFNDYAQRSITVEELMGGYANMGFQATAVGEAVRIVNDMRTWRHAETSERTTVFLGYTSNLISSGLRETLRYLVQHNHVSAIVTTAGGVEEDFIKCLAPTYLGSFATPGAGLRAKGMNRIGNLVVPNSNYCAFEDWVVPILDKMLEEQEASKKTDEPLHWTPSKVINRLGKEINDERSVYYWAWKNDIPVFCPALTDGSLGDMLFFHTFKSSPEQLRIDIVEDIRKVNSLAMKAKRAGMIILGGGVVKHHIANACLMRNGAESAVYINTAQEFDGSDAGARPDEAVSWGKIKADGDSVKVYAEATVVFPLIVAATFARVQAPPSFSSPPPPPQTSDDIDMSTSTTLPPTGQPHDRDDAVMQDGLTNGVEQAANSAQIGEPPNNIAVEVASVAADEDVMDIAPDASQDLIVPNGTANPLEANGISPASPVAHDVSQLPSGDNAEAQPAATNPDSALINPPPPIDPSLELPPPINPSLEPPPPPPPVEPVRSDTDSSDDDDGVQPWHPIQEDKSTPDDDELKEIEANTEHSALDHEHWEQAAFAPLEDPEYTAGASGRIEWLVDAYNGTREKPNRDLVMKSKPVNIGGYEWQIKFYPKGNDSDYLSVYVECLSVLEKGSKSNYDETDSDSSQESDAMVTSETKSESREQEPSKPTEAPREAQHTPLPLLGLKTVPKRKSVAAQVSVVLYNPGEPRVNVARTCLHRFCSASPDWGWTRYHGPYYDIAHRARGQRQALLRDDKLAFTGYIRVVEDETNCLWEHPSSDNIWDSFAMTGLQSMTLGNPGSGSSPSSGGNVISAIAPWMLLKPFRQLVYSVQSPNPEDEPSLRPKPLVLALQKVLYLLRTRVQPGSTSVALDPITNALEWYGIGDRLYKLDVVAVWEVIRTKLEEEIRDTPFSNVLDELCGPKRDYSTGVPSYRAPVVGVGSMQEAVNKSLDLTASMTHLPKLLTIELDRQAFDTMSRSYVKILNKVSLDDHIKVRGTPYTLYGFVAHKQTLQSYVYQPILRPEGPGSKWYSYSDNREGNMVKCLTRRQAIDMHEGTESKERVTGSDSVAYIVMYIRDDVKDVAFAQESEHWKVPSQIQEDGDDDTDSQPESVAEGEAESLSVDEAQKATEDTTPPEERQFQVIDSRAFLEHEGPGTFDVYGLKWGSNYQDLIHYVQLKATDSHEAIRDKLAALVGNIQDPRQLKFWFIETSSGSFARPKLLSTGKMEFSSGYYDRYSEQAKDEKLRDFPQHWASRRIWIHIVDVNDLPELPKEDPHVTSEPQAGHIQQPSDAAVVASNGGESAHTVIDIIEPIVEPLQDTPMSEPDESEPPRSNPPISDVPPPTTLWENTHGHDTAMVEVDARPPSDPPAVDVIIPNSGPADTEMGGTQDALPVPPPIPAEIPSEPTPVPVEGRPRTPEPVVERPRTPPSPPNEVYFFVKFFDAEKQLLVPKGSFIAHSSARLEATMIKLLGIPPDQKIELYEEKKLVSLRSLKGRKSFSSMDLANNALIVYTYPISPEQREALADRAAFADLQSFLTFRAKARNFPASINGHFTHNYFSSQYYKGEFKNGHRHGQGYRIYHSGATYEGYFRLSLRHGDHGRYTYQNGDTYDGQWVANQQHGTGTFTETATGNMYMGGWKNDKKFGEGVTHWKNAQETERLCRICWEESADAAFYDCGHVVACLVCARQVENCPVCRKRVLSAMKLYYVA